MLTRPLSQRPRHLGASTHDFLCSLVSANSIVGDLKHLLSRALLLQLGEQLAKQTGLLPLQLKLLPLESESSLVQGPPSKQRVAVGPRPPLGAQPGEQRQNQTTNAKNKDGSRDLVELLLDVVVALGDKDRVGGRGGGRGRIAAPSSSRSGDSGGGSATQTTRDNTNASQRQHENQLKSQSNTKSTQ